MNLTEDNYWSSRGRYQAKADRLADLIPPMGEVENAEQRPELERFRLAQNYYYDIFNNGVCNYEAEVWEMFRIAPEDTDDFDYEDRALRHRGERRLFSRTEPVMDWIILEAYAAEFTNKGDL